MMNWQNNIYIQEVEKYNLAFPQRIIEFNIREVRDTREGSLGLEGGLLSQITITNPITHPFDLYSLKYIGNKAFRHSITAISTYKAQCNCTGLKARQSNRYLAMPCALLSGLSILRPIHIPLQAHNRSQRATLTHTIDQ